MAQITEDIGSFANGLVTAQIDWNNANGAILRGRVINNSASPALMRVELNPPVNGWSSVELPAPANATTVQTLPNNTVKKTEVTEDGITEWKLLGVSLFCRWPA
jgi:hypothetical protein